MQGPSSSGTEAEKPLVVVAGRSNVGKSSIVRCLTGKKVRVGKKPGSTRREFLLDLGPLTLVDMQGFGHAERLSKVAIEASKRRTVASLETWGKRIAVAILVVDVSLFKDLTDRWEARGEIPIDIEFYSFLSEICREVIIVANKSDKLDKRNFSEAIEYLQSKMAAAEPERRPSIVVTSSRNKTGIDELKTRIEQALSTQGFAKPAW